MRLHNGEIRLICPACDDIFAPEESGDYTESMALDMQTLACPNCDCPCTCDEDGD